MLRKIALKLDHSDQVICWPSVRRFEIL